MSNRGKRKDDDDFISDDDDAPPKKTSKKVSDDEDDIFVCEVCFTIPTTAYYCIWRNTLVCISL